MALSRGASIGLMAAAAVAGAGSLAAQDPVAIVGRASRIYRNLTSLQAEFVQTIEDRSQGDTLTGRGTVFQSGANYFAMRFSDPPGEMIVADGTYLWTYTPSTAPNQVYRNPLPNDPVYGVNLLAKLLDRPQERYRASYVKRDTAGGRLVDVVDLIPTSTAVPFQRARIWLGIDDALPRRIEVDEGQGARRILVLNRIRPNAPAPKGTFSFAVPPGVKIVAPPG